MAWLSVLRGLLSLATLLAQYLNDKKLIEQGAAQELLRNLKASDDAIDKAHAARAAATKRHDDAGGLPDDNDPNLRD